MDLNPFLTFYIEAMLNVDVNANVKCEQTINYFPATRQIRSHKDMLQNIQYALSYFTETV